MSRTLNKLLRQTRKKEITLQHRLNLHQLLLCQFEVKVHIQSIDKLGDWIGILITLLFDDTDKFADLFLVGVRVAFAEMGSDYCGGEISKDPRT